MKAKATPGPKPNYRVRALDKTTEAKGTVGTAWQMEDGSISIALDEFVVLHGGKNLLLTLFPVEQ